MLISFFTLPLLRRREEEMLGKLGVACAGLPAAVLFLGPTIWILSLL